MHLAAAQADLLLHVKKNTQRFFYLAQRAFIPASVGAEPLIRQGRIRSEKEIRQESDKDKETWGNMLSQGLWDRQVESIIDVKIGNADADSYKYEPKAALLDWWETFNTDKHSKHCNYQQKYFPPFFLSSNGMLRIKYLVVLVQLCRTMSEKRNKILSHVRGWINVQIEIARSYSSMINRDQLPSPL